MTMKQTAWGYTWLLAGPRKPDIAYAVADGFAERQAERERRRREHAAGLSQRREAREVEDRNEGNDLWRSLR